MYGANALLCRLRFAANGSRSPGRLTVIAVTAIGTCLFALPARADHNTATAGMSACCNNDCGTCEGNITVDFTFTQVDSDTLDVVASLGTVNCTFPTGATYRLLHVNDSCTANSTGSWPVSFSIGPTFQLTGAHLADLKLGDVLAEIQGDYSAAGGDASAAVWGSLNLKSPFLPAVSTWGLVALVILLAVSATLVIRHRAQAAKCAAVS